MDNSVASVSREFRVACPGRGPKMPDPQFSEFLAQNWRYNDGTTGDCSFMLSVVPYRALQCDRCLVITTGSNRSAPFHGGNTGSNPVRDPNLINTLHEIWRAFPWEGMYSEQRIVDSRGPLEPNVSAWTDHCRYGGECLELAVGSTKTSRLIQPTIRELSARLPSCEAGLRARDARTRALVD